jgi:5-methylcytosine-specific restriction endonuclease McrA
MLIRKKIFEKLRQTVDHKNTEEEGGIDEVSNLFACCTSCNSSNGEGH